jgi:hypothetical protein
MTNSNYVAKQILTHLLKNGWVSTECFSSEHVERDIKNIIDNAAVCNINLDPKGFTFDSDISQTYTFSA